MITRRKAFVMLAAAAGAGAVGSRRAWAAPALSLTDMRGSIDAGAAGLRPARGEDQTARLLALIEEANRSNQWVFLPPGRYEVANLLLPDNTRLAGIAGATELAFAGGGAFVGAMGSGRIELANLGFNGAGLALPDEVPALLHLRDVADLSIDNCTLTGTIKTGVKLERCGGRIRDSRWEGIGEFGIYAVDSTGLSVTHNTLSDCGNGGIFIHRTEAGEDGSIVSNNRIRRTQATYGGTGPFGNAINIYRADNVIVSGNHISDSAFTAIRANASSNIQICDNQCLRSGETAIYSEFGFQGAIVTGNLVDGAANGINIANFNEGGRLAIVANNIIRNISLVGPYVDPDASFGIGIGVEADTVVSGNVIENVPLFALLLGWGPYLRNVAATGNIIRASKVGCAVSVVEDAGTALINDNLFEACEDGAILGYRWYDVATGELATGSETFKHLTLAGNRIS